MFCKTNKISILKTKVVFYRFYNTRKTRRKAVMKTNSDPSN